MANRLPLPVILLAFVSILSLPSCENSTEERFNLRRRVSKVILDSLSIDFLQGDTLHFTPSYLGDYLDFQTYSLNGVDYWVGLNPDDYRLDFYSLDLKVAVRSIQFEFEGPDGIKGGIDGFFYHNDDSIFLLSTEANQIYLMDDSANRVDLFDFNQVSLPDGFMDYDISADPGLQNGPFFVPSNKTLQFYTYRWYPASEDDFNYLAFASYSIEERRFVSIYGLFPDNYQRGNNYLLYNDPSLAVVDTISFIQFGASEYIAAYDNSSGELLYFSSDHCDHWPGPPNPLRLAGNEFQQERDWLVETAAYPMLLHDEENQLLFRFLKHKQPVLDHKGLMNGRWSGPWCITIYNYDLQHLGHYELPENALLPVIAFTAGGDIWIKNPKLPEDENTSLFYRFRSSVNEN